MATEILLTSETFVKSVSSISENVAGKYLCPSIREAQEIGLKSILGANLLNKLKALVGNGEIDGEDNARYKALIAECQYYLAYKAVSDLVPKIAVKIGNLGVNRATDEHLQSVSYDEASKLGCYYQAKADWYCKELQNYLLEHSADYPELTETQCHKIKSNLHSSATCGVFLGGARGRRI